jgi:hypothetical protein
MIGSKFKGLLQPIKKAEGIKTKREIIIPFKTLLILILLVEIKKPDIIHKLNAERLASQLRFCKIIGIKSIIPADKPNRAPFKGLFIKI